MTSESVKIKKNYTRLFRFDSIRISKLLEILQNSFIVFILSFFLGTFIDKFFKSEDVEKEDAFTLSWKIVLQFTLIVIFAYYIRKVVDIIPFFFSLTKDYVPSKKGEKATGVSLAMAIVFVGVQKNFLERLTRLRNLYGFNV